MSMSRSHMYVPGDREAVLAKAAGRGADALIIDLEDAVAPANKAAARETVATYLRAHIDVPDGPQLWVRLNSGDEALADLEVVAHPALSGVCLAKTESAAEIEAVSDALGAMESREGLDPGTVRISPLLETGNAVMRIREIAAAPRVCRLQVGEVDLAADVGIEPGPDERELLWVRSRVVIASAAASLEPPVAPVSTNFTDLDDYRASTAAFGRLGYRGRACIHPNQVAVVNEAFTPSADQLARAQELVRSYDAAVAAGDAVFVGADGRMMDLAVVRTARRTIEMAR